MLPTKCIQSWNHFMQLFIYTHRSYSYEKNFSKFDNLTIVDDETVSEFSDRFMLLCYKFHHDDLPPKKVLIEKFKYVVQEHNIRTYCEHKEESPSVNLNSKIDPTETLNGSSNPPQPSTSGENITSESDSMVPPNVCDNKSC